MVVKATPHQSRKEIGSSSDTIIRWQVLHECKVESSLIRNVYLARWV